jgi:molybdopterin converting factor small subunit
MSDILSNNVRKIEEDSIDGLKDRLSKLNKNFPKEYIKVLEKSKNFTVNGVLDLSMALTNRGLEVPSSLLEVVDISESSEGKINLKENKNPNDKLTLEQAKDLVNGWVQILKNISSIHNKDSKSLTPDLSNKDKKESMEFFKLSKESLKKLKSVVDLNPSLENNEKLKKGKVIRNLKTTFTSSLSQNLEWKDNLLEFKIGEEQLHIVYENNVFKFGLGNILLDGSFNENTVVSELKLLLESGYEEIENSKQNELLKILKTKFPELKTRNLEWDENNQLNFKINNKNIVIEFDKDGNKLFKLSMNGELLHTDTILSDIVIFVTHLTSMENIEDNNPLVDELKQEFPNLNNLVIKKNEFGHISSVLFDIKNDNVKIMYDTNMCGLLINGDYITTIKRNKVYFVIKDILSIDKIEDNEFASNPIIPEVVNENLDLPKKGVHYISLKDSKFSTDQKETLADLHNTPYIKKWLDKITNNGENLFLIGEASGLSDHGAEAWNYHDIGKKINIPSLSLDFPIQKFIRTKYPNKKIRGAIYDERIGLTHATVANEVYEQYIAVKLKEHFGSKFGEFQEHPSIQIPNLIIDRHIIGDLGDIKKNNPTTESRIKWLEKNYFNFNFHFEAYINDRVYTDSYGKILHADENARLRNNPDLQNKISELLLEKISTVLEIPMDRMPLKMEYREQKMSDKKIPIPFFKLKS